MLMWILLPIVVMTLTMVSPLPIALMITALTAMAAFITALYLSTSWFSYLVTMVFVSGMLVLFAYVSSVASNDKLLYTPNPVKPLLPTAFMLMLASKMNPPSTQTHLNSMPDAGPAGTLSSLTTLYFEKFSLLTSMTMLFLLLALLVVVKITINSKTPLRSMK